MDDGVETFVCVSGDHNVTTMGDVVSLRDTCVLLDPGLGDEVHCVSRAHSVVSLGRASTL